MAMFDPRFAALLLTISLSAQAVAQSTAPMPMATIEPLGCHAYLVYPPEAAAEPAASAPDKQLDCEPQPGPQSAEVQPGPQPNRLIFETVLATGSQP